jgi:two-component system cell cycle response regulator
MIHLANILIATEDAVLGQEILAKVRQHGYDGRVVASQQAALGTAQQEHPDILLVGSTLSEGDPLSLAHALRDTPNCADIPVALIATDSSVELKRIAMEAGFDDVLTTPLDDTKLVARLRPLVRLSTMHGELHQRARSAARFGVVVEEDLPRPTVDADYPLLLVGEAAEELRAPLVKACIVTANDPFVADDMLSSTNFDAAVVVPDDNTGPYLDLCAQTRNNPRLFNLPVLVVSKPGLISETEAYRHGASGWFERPVDPVALRTTVLGLVRRQRLRWSIREALGRTLGDTTRDPGTNLYNRRFLDAYLADRVTYAQDHGRHLSIMFFRVPDVEGIRQRFGEEQATHLRLQLGQWITGLLRGEDLTARYDENEFCVVLPDTPKEEAQIVMHRIAGVLAYTDFAVVDVYQPVKVWVRVGGADLTPDDSVDSLVERARRDVL